MISNKIIKIAFTIFLLVNIVNGQTTHWRLIWDQNPESDIIQYLIYKDTNSSPTTFIGSVTYPDTIYTDISINPGIRYYYRVRAQNDSGLISPYSSDVSAAIPQIVNWPDTLRLPPDSSHTFDLDNYVNDPDNSVAELDWSVTGNSQLNVQINSSTHITTIQTPGGWSSHENLVYTVVDPDSFEDVRSLIILAAQMPFISNQISDKSYAEDTGPHTVVSNLNNVFSDPDPGDILTFTASSDNQDITVSVQGNTLLVNSILNYYGSGIITVTATDLYGLSTNDIFSVIIRTINDAPGITGIPDITFPKDSSYAIDLDNYVTDVDNSTASLNWDAVVLSVQPVTGKRARLKINRGFIQEVLKVDTSDLQININPTTHIATFTATDDSSGIFEVEFTVTDDSSASDTDTINVTVTLENHSPYVANQISDTSYAEDTGPYTVVSNLNNIFSYPDPGEILTFTASSDSSDIQAFVQSDTTLIVTSSQDYFGDGIITVIATDLDGLSASDTFRVTITPVNDAPEFVNDIPEQVIGIGELFSSIFLDNYVKDIDNSHSELKWLSDDSLQNFKVNIDTVNRIATISVLDCTWSGYEFITFKVLDPESLYAESSARFEVNRINMAIFSTIQMDYFGSGTTIRLKWTTTGETKNLIEYGLDQNYGDSTIIEERYQTEHLQIIEGLLPGTTYHYRIVSQDTNGIKVYSANMTFATGEAWDINVFPIPYLAGGLTENDVINFVSLPLNSSIFIYNILGEPVFKTENVSHLYRWSVLNNANKKVQAGLYIYIIRDKENKKVSSGKLVVIR